MTSFVFSSTCPSPETSPLKDGKIPLPWLENPFAPNSPLESSNAHFYSVNILVAGGRGIGVVCTYRFPSGEYGIWQPASVHVPSANDERWIRVVGGYLCIRSLNDCSFEMK